MPNNSNLSFLVSLNPRDQAGDSGRQRDSGEAILQYVPKAVSAEPQQRLPKPVGVLLSLLFVPKIRPIKTVSTGQISSKFSSRL